MTNISNNGLITMNRGDTFSYPIYINLSNKAHTEWYLLDKDDTIYISVCEPNAIFEHGIIRKVLTKDDFDIEKRAWFKLSSAETENLLPGTYYYEIKIKLFNGSVSTIVPRKKFIILE